ncbi:universal stress protein UspA-like protein [Desulfosporosinus acidiphilus SJ4]|uniref:Universal stress protein n=1 Tax=Desulfosporosinus acidiphilus (strain DSM 22704 / JCM 16185 / SJ4) TaxID=646529 RepID=I4D1P9_DESAJ|nr:universal stress protein [Desulfosporosinus acidiphilus]AFM39723.1 universal stress protein UspA-like protein [Desulfosporosinus acidiphilus SJ4]
MKKILVATDASGYSRKALLSALELARIFNAVIELLFVMEMPIAYESTVFAYLISPENIEKESENVFENTLRGIDTSGVTVIQKKIVGRRPGEVIIQEAESENIDLIVMGSHGYGAFTGTLLGSVSQYVIHKAKCSVLIAK